MDNSIDTVNSTNKKHSIISTFIKFSYDENTKTFLAFVRKKTKEKLWIGCRERENCKKKVVVPSGQLVELVIPDVLYKAELIPMKNDKGFIATKIEIVKFPAGIETTIKPNRFKAEIKFGNKVVIYDPQKGRQENRRFLPKVMDILKARVDIEDKENALEQFYNAATLVSMYYVEYKKHL